MDRTPIWKLKGTSDVNDAGDTLLFNFSFMTQGDARSFRAHSPGTGMVLNLGWLLKPSVAVLIVTVSVVAGSLPLRIPFP